MTTLPLPQGLCVLLESLGYEVSCWEQGEIPRRGKFAPVGVLLLDMRMPVLDGHAVHEIMRQKAKYAGGGLSHRARRCADGG